MKSQTKAVVANEVELARRGLLLLLGAGAAWFLTARFAFGQTVTDPDGNPIRLPGQTLTPDTQYRERQSIEQSQERTLDNRANARAADQERQIQNDRAAAQQRENAVQQNLDQQRLDILNNRDK
jgi:hypothetical protein